MEPEDRLLDLVVKGIKQTEDNPELIRVEGLEYITQFRKSFKNLLREFTEDEALLDDILLWYINVPHYSERAQLQARTVRTLLKRYTTYEDPSREKLEEIALRIPAEGNEVKLVNWLKRKGTLGVVPIKE